MLRAKNQIGTLSLILTIVIVIGLLQFISFQSENVVPDGSAEILGINNLIKIIVGLGVTGLLAITVIMYLKFSKHNGLPHESKKLLVERFSPIQIIIHAVTGISILTLYVTGIPLLYPEHLAWITEMIGLSKNMFIHRIAGMGLVSAAIYYLIITVMYVRYVDPGWIKNVIPTSKDIIDALNDIKSVFGIGARRVEFGKYNWLEKVDIMSVVVFDGLIMSTTGLILMTPWLFTSFIPKSYILTINVLHGGFAVLSLCGILLHFSVVHLRPDRFPMDYSIFTGTIPLNEAKEEYSLWIKDISGDEL